MNLITDQVLQIDGLITTFARIESVLEGGSGVADGRFQHLSTPNTGLLTASNKSQSILLSCLLLLSSLTYPPNSAGHGFGLQRFVVQISPAGGRLCSRGVKGTPVRVVAGARNSVQSALGSPPLPPPPVTALATDPKAVTAVAPGGHCRRRRQAHRRLCYPLTSYLLPRQC